MTSPGSSRAAATTSAATLLGLLTITLAVLLGCLSPGVSACGGAPAAAEDALKKSTVPPNSTATNGRGGGAHATDAKPAPAYGNPTSRWPDGMPGLWTGEHLPGSKGLEGMKCMIFITPDVSENLVVIFTKEDDDAIATAMLSENIGIELREGGKFIWLNRAVATSDDQIGGDLRGQLPSSTGTRCFSSTLEGDVMYVLGKTVDLSFEGCPEPPVAAVMRAPGFDLAALGADFGIVLVRTPVDDTVKWPAQFPGMWKGEIMGSATGGSIAIGNDAPPSKGVPICFSVVQGRALNAWIYFDPENPHLILSANIGRATNSSSSAVTAAAPGTTPGEASFSFVNHPFKYTPGDTHPAGRKRWFSRFVILRQLKDDMIYALSNPAPGVTDAALPAVPPPAFPNTPDPARLAEALDADDFAALGDTGAAVALIMTKVQK